MRTTRLVLLSSLLTAIMVVAGQTLAGIPNVELLTFLAFVSGYLLGVWPGLLIGVCGMGAHSLFNVMGAVPPPVWIAQMACYGAVGVAGGLFGPALARMTRAGTASVLAGTLGALLALGYQLVVNAVSFFTFTSNVSLWVYLWGGLVFAAVQVVWNAGLFFVALRPTLRVLARYRRELAPIR